MNILKHAKKYAEICNDMHLYAVSRKKCVKKCNKNANIFKIWTQYEKIS